MTKKTLLLFTTFLIFSFQSAAQIVPNDWDYQVLKKDKHRLVYSKDNAEVAEYALNKFIKVSNLYKQEYGWELDEVPTLVLASNKNQFQNGFATTIPRLITTFFPAFSSSSFSTHSWIDTLIYHEVAHLYQLNAKPGKNSLPALAHTLLGNPLFLIIPPIMVNPNVLLPSMFTEGNATWNESRFSNGGRLHSGQNLALINQMALSGKIKDQVDINSTLEFPFNREYLVGSYFQEFLANKFGKEKLNQFFVAQSNNFVLPLIIDSTFKKHFGESFYNLFAEFVKDRSDKANGFTKSSEPILFRSFSHTSFNHSKKHIYLTTNSNENSYNKIITINKTTKKIKKISANIKRGKLFRLKKKWAVSASGKIKKTKRAYTLYKTGARFHKKFIDHAVLDIRGNSWASFYVPKSYKKNQLYKNGSFVAEADSEAILDDSGNIYYFKQSGPTRSLYKNESVLFSIEGHYSYPLEVLENGGITFIATSNHGSSLYVFDNGSIKRLHNSDAIVDARHLNSEQYFISEASFDGYNYKIVTTIPSASIPKPIQLSFSSDNDPLTAEFKATETPAKKYKYNSLSQLKLGSLSPDFIALGSELGIGATALWTDPMLRNSISIQYKQSGGDTSARAIYENSINSLNWSIGATYNKETGNIFSTTRGAVLTDTLTQIKPFINFNYLLFDLYEIRANIQATGGYQSNKLDIVNFEETGTFVTGAASLVWQKSFARSFDSHRLLALTYLQSYENLKNSISNVQNESIFYSVGANSKYNLGNETYLGLRHNYLRSESNDIEIDSSNNTSSRDYFSLSTSIENIRELSATEASIKKAFHTPIYSSLIPLSLRRIAPKLSATYFDYKEFPVNRNFNFTEVAAFLEMEWLFVHKQPFRLSFGVAKNRGADSAERNFNWQIILNL